MSKPTGTDPQGTSTRPYLIRALHDWCTDNGFTPYVAVHVDPTVQVPMEYVKNHEIVLNVGFEATSGLKLGNDFIEFKARFGGVARDIVVPVDHVVAIYARENGQGMAFPVPTESGGQPTPADAGGAEGGPRVAPRTLHLAKPDGMSGRPETTLTGAERADAPPTNDQDPSPPDGTGGGRPSLRRVK